jgi:hypothetical protein
MISKDMILLIFKIIPNILYKVKLKCSLKHNLKVQQKIKNKKKVCTVKGFNMKCKGLKWKQK